jgi:hypothetical protein
VSGSSDYPRGNPELPLSTRELEDKFLTLVEPRFGRDTANSALQAVHTLEDCPEMATVFRDILPRDAEVPWRS